MQTAKFAAVACLLVALACFLKRADSTPRECDDCNTTSMSVKTAGPEATCKQLLACKFSQYNNCGYGLTCQKVGLGLVSRCRCLDTSSEFSWTDKSMNKVACWKELEGTQLSVHNGGDACSETQVKALPRNSERYNWEAEKKKISDKIKKSSEVPIAPPHVSTECDACSTGDVSKRCRQSLNPFAITLTCQKLGNGATSKCRCVDGTNGWGNSLKNSKCKQGLGSGEIQNHGDDCN